MTIIPSSWYNQDMLEIEAKSFAWNVLGLRNTKYQDTAIDVIPDDVLNYTWQTITSTVELPCVVAVVLPSDTFDYIDRRMKESEFEVIEYGKTKEQLRRKWYLITRAFVLIDPIVWDSIPVRLIVLRKGCETSLTHELQHILESISGMQCGDLTHTRERFV